MAEIPRSSIHRWFRYSWSLLRAVGVPYLLVLLLLLVYEDELIHPGPKYPSGDWHTQQLTYEDVYFHAADGTRLHGWYVPHEQSRAEVIYFHGNGENVAYTVQTMRKLSETFQISIFVFDYRGYGRSEGKANEAGVLADAEAALRWLMEHTGAGADEIVLHGRSLGGAAAIHVAAEYGTRGLILEDTFTSMPDVAARLYWWAPVRQLMRTRYDSAAKLCEYRGPLLQGHGNADRLVPLSIAKRLHDCCPSTDKRLIVMPGKGHNDPALRDFFLAVGDFYDQLGARAASSRSPLVAESSSMPSIP